ncbi:hypothetical protein QJS66_17480 [Kocuria rhizophila]|nr:hypothetical protein QJS66_17480 [Kocuria rhizophila]
MLEPSPRGCPPVRRSRTPPQGQQAECVMLDKGPFVVEAIRTLSSVLERMSGHASKTDLLRRLNAWESSCADPPERAVCRPRACVLGVRGARARAPPRALPS